MFNVLYASYSQKNTLFKLSFTFLLLSPLALFLGIAPFDIMLTGVGFLFITYSFMHKDFSWLHDAWMKIFLLLWIYMIVRGFFTIDPQSSVLHSLSFIRFAVFTAALQHWLLKSSPAREALAISLVLTLVFAAGDGLLQLFTYTDLFGKNISPIDFSQSWRLNAISGKPNIGAKFSTLILPAVAYLMLRAFNQASKYRYLISTLMMLLAFLFVIFIPLTGERNATLVTFLGLGLMFLLCKQQRIIISMVLASALLFLTLLSIYNPGFRARTMATLGTIQNISTVFEKRIFHNNPDWETSKVSSESAPDPYVSLWKTDWNIFKANPVFGVGRKQYNAYCNQAPLEIAITKVDYNACLTNAQNIYLEWLAETGLIGLALFSLMVLVWLRSFYIKRGLLLANTIALAAGVELLLRLWPLASTSSFFFSWWGGPFWLMAGWVLAYLAEDKPQKI